MEWFKIVGLLLCGGVIGAVIMGIVVGWALSKAFQR